MSATVSLAGAAVSKGVPPDIVLSKKTPVVNRAVNTLLVNDLTPVATDEAGENLAPTADQCRDLPPLDIVCDVYRIKIVRDTTKGAQNFVQVIVDWPSQVSTPALALVAAGLSDSDLPDIDLFLYENTDTYVDSTFAGGRSANVPERLVWLATQDEYDLVVRSGTGVVNEYTINARLSNETFGKPFEVLDELTPNGPAKEPPEAAVPPPVALTPNEPPPLALAPLDVDAQIAGVGLGTTERFDALELPVGSKPIAARAEPPSALALLVALVLLPLVVAAAAVFGTRRRHARIS